MLLTEKSTYRIWKQICKEKPMPSHIVEKIKKSGLRGRGGACFESWIKFDQVLKNNSSQKYIICNSDEGELGTFKDRDIILRNSQQIIEGMAIAGYTVGATIGYHYINKSFTKQIEVFSSALEDAKNEGLIGNNINNSGIDFKIVCFYSDGDYICGEETALIESIEGNLVQPRQKPPYPTEQGLYECPTLICNTETIANIPVVLSESFNNKNLHKIFSISGNVNNSGNYEVPLGTPFSELLNLAGGIVKGKKLKAVIPGGISSPILPADIIMQLNMDYESLQKAGSSIGTGGVIVFNEDVNMVSELSKILSFYFRESCGKCTPCREGIGWALKIVNKCLSKNGTREDVRLLKEIADKISNKSLCALGDSVAVVIYGFLKYFEKEFFKE